MSTKRKLTKADAKRLDEAKGALQRAEHTLSQGSNRYGEYGRNTHAIIDRCRKVIEELSR